MNIRSLTRGDGVVIGAAVLLFIASFLDVFSVDNAPDSLDLTSAWDSGPLLMGVTFSGIIAAACIVLGRGLPQPPKVIGIDLVTLGTAFAILTAWNALGQIFDPAGGVENMMGGDGPDAGIGLILSLIAALAMAAGAVLSMTVPALKAPLMGAGGPAPAPAPYGGPSAPQAGYGYPGPGAQATPAPYGQQQNFGAQAPAPAQAQPAQAQPAAAQPAAPAENFSPFWFAVPVARPLYAEDGSSATIAELAPGTWYLAVEQRGQALVAQTQDGRRGVLQDTTGIQRG
ncbi:hypothetical protein [Streptomyces palmae]|uniref:Uncharacterized protein n=1 Tax=Streptomyces palmae TaxID=1701085 RepID=A0A4Z0GIQ2_9ACTN|nr:hypothetical protein [Streptomyces palmae]TGA95570.1 hypothetical protein E4099_25055 [Streptomyces palmae]